MINRMFYTRDGKCLRQVPYEHVEKKKPSLAGLPFWFLAFLPKQVWQTLETKKPKLSLWFFFICTRDGT